MRRPTRNTLHSNPTQNLISNTTNQRKFQTLIYPIIHLRSTQTTISTNHSWISIWKHTNPPQDHWTGHDRAYQHPPANLRLPPSVATPTPAPALSSTPAIPPTPSRADVEEEDDQEGVVLCERRARASVDARQLARALYSRVSCRFPLCKCTGGLLFWLLFVDMLVVVLLKMGCRFDGCEVPLKLDNGVRLRGCWCYDLCGFDWWIVFWIVCDNCDFD